MQLYAYKEGSQGAKALAQGLGIKRIKHVGSKFKGSQRKLVINWGCSELPPEVMKCRVFNNPAAVKLASNKLSFFNKMYDYNVQAMLLADVPPLVSLPDFTADKEVVAGWLAGGATVVARQKLQGHSGEGIVIIKPGERVVDAPLYVKYVPKQSEWRIHVLDGVVVDIQRKARNREVADENVNWAVRNHANGFVYARNEGVAPPAMVEEQAILAVQVCGLDFGAVDIIYNDHRKLAYVLEINTAPGLTGSTLDGYVERFNVLGG